ncbi:hypothetical protein JCM17204_31180 [Blautia stercoris]
MEKIYGAIVSIMENIGAIEKNEQRKEISFRIHIEVLTMFLMRYSL